MIQEELPDYRLVMRIITGKARGLHLNVPKNYDVRPTADRVKESLFNIIGFRIQGAAVLDLFAGSGNLGLESWSRGASRVEFSDKNRISLQLVESNIKKCRAEGACRVNRCDAESAISRFYKAGDKFDFIFIDPPYNKGWIAKVLKKLETMPILSDGGWIIVEHSAHEPVEGLVPSGYELFRSQKYGETFLAFLKKEVPAGE